MFLLSLFSLLYAVYDTSSERVQSLLIKIQAKKKQKQTIPLALNVEIKTALSP